MCEQHSGLSRRAFGALTFGGLAVFPLASVAGPKVTIDALAVTCIDYRFVSPQVAFLDRTVRPKQYDQVALAGASLAAVSTTFPKSVAAFWEHVGLARKLHNIGRVVFIDHRGCGAYEAEFGEILPGPDHDADELEQHKKVMREAKARLNTLHHGLGSAFYLTELNGRINPVTI